MEIIAIIPARMGSSRFPGKPLALIHGMPMLGHVYFRTRMCRLLRETYVATCDREIFDYVHSVGGRAVMTLDSHERCSDRTAEAMLKIEAELGHTVDIVVMVQGDEPMVTPGMIEAAVRPMLQDSSISVVNLMAMIGTPEEFEDPNEVKVVVGLHGKALYFSREPIPSRKKGVSEVPMLKQVCVIPFRRDYLLKFNALSPTPLEQIESVDMLRIIEHGDQVHMVMTDANTVSVDTPADLERAKSLLQEDKLLTVYLSKPDDQTTPSGK
jgi:3-deoxy-manno-octulosonate cytidylyltransferase (CMP-KDO synthetase)